MSLTNSEIQVYRFQVDRSPGYQVYMLTGWGKMQVDRLEYDMQLWKISAKL